MVKEIRIYVEGGGDQKSGRQLFELGFGKFLRDLRERARQRRTRWRVIACGGRQQAWDHFRSACQAYRDALNVLVVDSEGAPLAPESWQHLKLRDGWHSDAAENQCFLMIQAMEAWLLADRQMLAQYFGKGFRESALPAATRDIETVDRAQLVSSLEAAARNTGKKGYHKIRDGCALLERVRFDVVCKSAPSCWRLASVLTATIDGS